MLKKTGLWYRAQPPKIRLVITFLCNFAWWFLAKYTGDLIFETEEAKTFKGLVISSLIMALFWTLFFHWKLVKKGFSKSSSSTINGSY
jgi:hypothetical protein